MGDPVRQIRLSNNLLINFFDTTSHYYGGFYHVSVLAVIELELCPEYCQDDMTYNETVALVGEKICHQHLLERMGVNSEDLQSVREHLIDQFARSSSPYLSAPDFPARLVATEVKKLSKKKNRAPARFSAR